MDERETFLSELKKFNSTYSNENNQNTDVNLSASEVEDLLKNSDSLFTNIGYTFSLSSSSESSEDFKKYRIIVFKIKDYLASLVDHLDYLAFDSEGYGIDVSCELIEKLLNGFNQLSITLDEFKNVYIPMQDDEVFNRLQKLLENVNETKSKIEVIAKKVLPNGKNVNAHNDENIDYDVRGN